MPYINIKNAGELTREQKEELVLKITQVVAEVTGKNPEKTYICVDEVPRENFAVGGKLLG